MFKKISELNETTETVDEDVFPVVNSGETKKLKMSSLVNYLKTALGSVFANRNHSHGKADITDFPTKLSQFQNDAGYVNKDSDNLENYTKTSDLANVATSGSYNDLDNKPELADVALSGSYDDLDDKPTIPDISGKEDRSNKVSELNENSTNDQYPGAKAVYEELQTLYSAFPTATATGETINVQDSSNLPLKEFDLLGNATQETTSIAGGDEYDSPTPDHPQDIHVVTGDNTVKVCGKNLFDKNNVVDGKRFGSDGQYYNDSNYCASDYIRIAPNTRYVFNALGSSECICTYDKDKNFIARVLGNGYTGITTAENAIYVRVAILKTNKDIWQLEQNTTATNYQPYTEQTQLLSLGTIELAKIGNYTDRIFKDSGKWYVEKNIGKITLIGTENITKRTSDSTRSTFNIVGVTSDFMYVIGSQNVLALASHYYARAYNVSWPIGSMVYSTTELIVVNPIATISYDVDAFKTWLSNNNVTIYYVKKVPTTTEITDTTLIEQLENVLKMHTNKNVTNAWIEPSGTNAQAGLTLTYYIDLNTLVNTAPATLSTNSLNTNLLMNPSSLTNIDDNNDETI